MKQFSQLGVKVQPKSLQGDKISLESVLNKQITVLDYRIENSKFDKGNGKCVYLQIEWNSEKRVLFSGSGYLMEALEDIEKTDFPFLTTIIKINKGIHFS